MSTHRYHLAADQWSDDGFLTLAGDEARHCAEVLRGKLGDTVSIFDGAGGEAHGTVAAVESRLVRIKVLGRTRVPAPLVRIGLAQAIPKGRSMELVIQKATELGAGEIIPILSERTVVKLDARAAEKKRQKWERVALEACKQCGRSWVPVIANPVRPEQFVKDPGSWELRFIASLQPDSRRLKDFLAERAVEEPTAPSSALVMVGPEGDFTPAEISTARGKGFLPLGLGPIVLRAETAAMHCLSILSHELT